jgi:hypothetical protein
MTDHDDAMRDLFCISTPSCRKCPAGLPRTADKPQDCPYFDRSELFKRLAAYMAQVEAERDWLATQCANAHFAWHTSIGVVHDGVNGYTVLAERADDWLRVAAKQAAREATS